MANVGGDVVLLRTGCGPRVRFLEEVRVRDYNDFDDLESELDSRPLDRCFHRLERLERLKGASDGASKRRLSAEPDQQSPTDLLLNNYRHRRRKCALVMAEFPPFSSCDGNFLQEDVDTAEDDSDHDEIALRAFLDNSPPDRDLSQPLSVSLILYPAPNP